MRARLQQAALELYRERGYDRTTTAEIAARAGVTERTFFRHFPDKREVLFDGEAGLLVALAKAVVEAPQTLGPLEVLLRTFQSIEKLLTENRPFTEPRREVIVITPALQERAEAKTASVTAALASALERRGVDAPLASLAARVGMAAFSHALNAWVDDPAVSLGVHLRRAFQAVRGLSGSD